MLNTKFLNNILFIVSYLKNLISQFRKQKASRSYYLSFIFFSVPIFTAICEILTIFFVCFFILALLLLPIIYRFTQNACRKFHLLLNTSLVLILADECKMLQKHFLYRCVHNKKSYLLLKAKYFQNFYLYLSS